MAVSVLYSLGCTLQITLRMCQHADFVQRKRDPDNYSARPLMGADHICVFYQKLLCLHKACLSWFIQFNFHFNVELWLSVYVSDRWVSELVGSWNNFTDLCTESKLQLQQRRTNPYTNYALPDRWSICGKDLDLCDRVTSVAVVLNDLYSFSPATVQWMELSPSGSIPSPRISMGFTSTADGMLYVFGGWNNDGEKRVTQNLEKVAQGERLVHRICLPSIVENQLPCWDLKYLNTIGLFWIWIKKTATDEILFFTATSGQSKQNRL